MGLKKKELGGGGKGCEGQRKQALGTRDPFPSSSLGVPVS